MECYTEYLLTKTVQKSKVVMKLFIFQGSLVKKLFIKTDYIIYLQKHTPLQKDLPVAPLLIRIFYGGQNLKRTPN